MKISSIIFQKPNFLEQEIAKIFKNIKDLNGNIIQLPWIVSVAEVKKKNPNFDFIEVIDDYGNWKYSIVLNLFFYSINYLYLT